MGTTKIYREYKTELDLLTDSNQEDPVIDIDYKALYLEEKTKNDQLLNNIKSLKDYWLSVDCTVNYFKIEQIMNSLKILNK